MPEDADDVHRVIVEAIYRHARGDPDALATAIMAELAAAGFRIVRDPGSVVSGGAALIVV